MPPWERWAQFEHLLPHFCEIKCQPQGYASRLYCQVHTLHARLACRYALLYTFGGFYMDLDIECWKPMGALRAYPFIMPQTRPVGFSNDFLASTPGAQPSQLAEGALPFLLGRLHAS